MTFSVTVSGVTLGDVYVCVVCTPDATAESPKSHSYATIDPSGSPDAEASKSTSSGAGPCCGVAVKDAVGGRFGRPGEICRLFASEAYSSATITVTVYGPSSA